MDDDAVKGVARVNTLERLKKLAKAATPGPWALNPDGAEEWWYNDTILGEGGAGGALASCTGDNAELIVTLHNALPDLLAVVEALKKVNDYLGEGCPISQIISRFADDFVASGSQDGLVEKGEALQAALAKLTEAPHED